VRIKRKKKKMRADPAAPPSPMLVLALMPPMAALALASAPLPRATAATRPPQRGGRLRGEVATQVGPALGSSSDGGEGAPSGSSSGGGEGPELRRDEERGAAQADSSALTASSSSRASPFFRVAAGSREGGGGMLAPWSFCCGEEARPPEKEPSRPATEEATMGCGGSRGREVRGWRPEVEQRRGRCERASVKKGPPVGAGWFCRQNAGGESHGVRRCLFLGVEIAAGVYCDASHLQQAVQNHRMPVAVSVSRVV
jgi:hypothetical protein